MIIKTMESRFFDSFESLEKKKFFPKK